MPALRIMTFNVQMLPLVAMFASGQSDDAKARAEWVANAILDLPTGEQPDVIAFNEVFNEDGRSELLARLRSRWPNVIEKMSDGLFDEDSGLMLFSKFPFLTLPNGEKLYELFYGDNADTDARASKGVGMVQIGTPIDKTTIAFTHLQASYVTEDEYSDVRARQMNDIFTAIEEVLDGETGFRGRVIVLGDLNVRGEPGSVSGEWAAVFEQGGSALFGPYTDGWHTYMHPPGERVKDDGATNVDYKEPSKRQRLDYMCFCRRDSADIVLVPQHMRVRLRNQSDHFAVEALVNEFTDHCVPSDAIGFLSIAPNAGGQPGVPTSVRQANLSFPFDDSYQWLYVAQEGTYTVHRSREIVTEIYLVSDMSHPVARIDTLDFRLLPDDLKVGYREHQIDPRGETFVCREPFFVLAKTVDGRKGSGVVWLLEHKGESDVTAISLLLHREVASSFPPGQMLGADDKCWFRADMPPTYQGVERTETFRVHNPSGGGIRVNVLDEALAPLTGESSGADAELVTSAGFKGGERTYVTIERDHDQLTGFTVTWESPVSYLDLNEPLFLYVNDESGPDWPGSDEPEMQINLDTGGSPIFAGTWDDADTGERWPNLAETIRGKIALKLPGVTKVGFVEGIFIGYIEPDFNAQGWPFEFVNPLSPGEEDRKVRTVSLPVPDVLFDGLYTFTCTLSRFP